MEIVPLGEDDLAVSAVLEKPEAVEGLLVAPSPQDQLNRWECREPQTDAALSGMARLEEVSAGRDLQGRNRDTSSNPSSTSFRLMSGLANRWAGNISM